ncbi:glycosyltransferase family 2 protein [Flavobacterium sp. FlaQc-52]|uniref:glycosyltransferase family 2 protein n=1 Tax=Flavobacterium sp. FlaQc-52 TaxID=3374185 RepID=UPI0037564D9D
MNKVSIIVPCYNQAHYLPEALHSVLCQMYINWECIIINDGSFDNTEQVAREWLLKDNRFKYIFKENGGLSSARNAGLDFANGDYVQFLDADDYLDSEKLSKSVNIIRKDSINTVIVSNFKFFKKSLVDELGYGSNLDINLFTFQKILFEWDSTFSIPIHCGFFSSSLFDEFRFNEDIRAKEDWIMWLYIFQREISFDFLNEKLAFYRQHSEGMTRNKKHMFENTIKAFSYIENLVTREDYNFFLLHMISKKMREYDELNLKVEELKKRIINSNNSIGFKIEKKIKKYLKKLNFIGFF